MHRPVFPVEGTRNDFWHISLEGEYYYDDQPADPPESVLEKFSQHDADGWHPECVICEDYIERDGTHPSPIICGGNVFYPEPYRPATLSDDEEIPF